MPFWETVIYSYNKKTKEVEVYEGRLVEAFTPRLAQQWLDSNELGYMKVTGMEIIEDVYDNGEVVNYEKKHQWN